MNDPSLKRTVSAVYLLKPLCDLWLVWPVGLSASWVQTLPQTPECPRGVPCQEVMKGGAVDGESGWTGAQAYALSSPLQKTGPS